jgi:hypothetical protein
MVSTAKMPTKILRKLDYAEQRARDIPVDGGLRQGEQAEQRDANAEWLHGFFPSEPRNAPPHEIRCAARSLLLDRQRTGGTNAPG